MIGPARCGTPKKDRDRFLFAASRGFPGPLHHIPLPTAGKALVDTLPILDEQPSLAVSMSRALASQFLAFALEHDRFRDECRDRDARPQSLGLRMGTHHQGKIVAAGSEVNAIQTVVRWSHDDRQASTLPGFDKPALPPEPVFTVG